jgi:hypothetical protein
MISYAYGLDRNESGPWFNKGDLWALSMLESSFYTLGYRVQKLYLSQCDFLSYYLSPQYSNWNKMLTLGFYESVEASSIIIQTKNCTSYHFFHYPCLRMWGIVSEFTQALWAQSPPDLGTISIPE